MTSEKDVYTWIADYACKYRLADLITDLFKDVDGSRLSFSDLSYINLKNALVWMTVTNDCQEEYEDAVMAVDSVLDEAITSGSLEIFIRLSLGLRLKDLSHSLSLPTAMFEQKLKRHFPGSKFQLDKKYLSQVFSEKELRDFENVVAEVCQYFRTVAKEETEKMNLLANYPQSQFGIKLSESLKSLTQELFDKLSHDQPLNKLEQIVKFGTGKFVKGNSSPWYNWLRDRLSGVQTLSNDVVRDLMVSLQWHEAVGQVTHLAQDDGKVGAEQKIKSLKEVTKFINARSVQEVCLSSDVEFSDDSCQEDDNNSLDFDDSSSFVPSSQGQQDIWTHEKLNDDKNDAYRENYSLPNLKQFLKQGGMRSCVVMLHRI